MEMFLVTIRYCFVIIQYLGHVSDINYSFIAKNCPPPSILLQPQIFFPEEDNHFKFTDDTAMARSVAYSLTSLSKVNSVDLAKR